MTKAEGGRGVCAKPPYGRCPNPCPINPLPKSAPQFPAPPPTAAIIALSRRTGARSAGDPQRRRERKERAQPEAGSRKGSLAEGMRGRAGWKAGRLKGAGWIPAPVQEMVAAIPARRVQKDPSSTARPIVRACGSPSARSVSLRRNGINQSSPGEGPALRQRPHHRGRSGARGVNVPNSLCCRHPGGAKRTPGPSGAVASAIAKSVRRIVPDRSALSRAAGSRALPGLRRDDDSRGRRFAGLDYGDEPGARQCAPAPVGRCCFSCLPTRVTRVLLAAFIPVSTTSAPWRR